MTFAPRYMNYMNHFRNSWSEISSMKCVDSRTSFYRRHKNWSKNNLVVSNQRIPNRRSIKTFVVQTTSVFWCLTIIFFNWVRYDTRITLKKKVSITSIVRTRISLIRHSSVSLIKLVIRWLRLFEKTSKGYPIWRDRLYLPNSFFFPNEITRYSVHPSQWEWSVTIFKRDNFLFCLSHLTDYDGLLRSWLRSEISVVIDTTIHLLFETINK